MAPSSPRRNIQRLARRRAAAPAGVYLVLALTCLPQASRGDTEPGPRASCREGSKLVARLELVFGARKPRGVVGPRAFARFLATEVTPRFPDGLTVFDGYGQWQTRMRGAGRERSRLLLIWYEPDGSSEAKIEAIRQAYKTRFRQGSVLRADGASCISF